MVTTNAVTLKGHVPDRKAYFAAIFIACQGVAMGALMLGAGSASTIFPAMRSLAPSVDAWQPPVSEHWALIAGFAQARAFMLMNWILGVSLVIAAILFVPTRRIVARTGSVITAHIFTLFACMLALLAMTYLTWIAPTLHSSAAAIIELAAGADADALARERTSFASLHQPAQLLMALMKLCVIVSGAIPLFSVARYVSRHMPIEGDDLDRTA